MEYETAKSKRIPVFVFNTTYPKDGLNMDHWEFYVISTHDLNNYKRSQHSISLKSLKGLTNAVSYEELNETISKSVKITSLK